MNIDIRRRLFAAFAIGTVEEMAIVLALIHRLSTRPQNLVLNASTPDDSLPKPLGLLDAGPCTELQATENDVPLLLRQLSLPLDKEVE
jgi:hypothetical protein